MDDGQRNVQRPVIFSAASGRRAPPSESLEAASSICLRSFSVSSTRCSFVIPGMCRRSLLGDDAAETEPRILFKLLIVNYLVGAAGVGLFPVA